jgi:HEAT repeats
MNSRAFAFPFVIASFATTAVADVLHTTDGRKLVGEVVRRDSAAASISTLDGLVVVPANEITSSVTANDLRDELRRLAKGNESHDAARQHQFARFAAQRGLYAEAIDHLDAALRASIADGLELDVARELLDLPIGGDYRNAPLTPNSLGVLLAVSATASSPAPAHLAMARIESKLAALGKPVPGPLVAALGESLNDRDPRVRLAALRAIRSATPPDLAPRVGDLLVADTDAAVRAEAIRTASAYGQHPAILVQVLQQLDRGTKARAAALDTLEALADPHAVAALVRTLAGDGSGFRGFTARMSVTNQVAYVSDFDVQVANNATIADPIVNVAQEGATLDVTVYGVSERGISRSERERIGRLLDRLTGMNYGANATAWKSWLRSRG